MPIRTQKVAIAMSKQSALRSKGTEKRSLESLLTRESSKIVH
jgi:hypothetical protein